MRERETKERKAKRKMRLDGVQRYVLFSSVTFTFLRISTYMCQKTKDLPTNEIAFY